MKHKLSLALTFFLVVYTILAILMIMMETSNDVTLHVVFSILGIACLAILNSFREQEKFVRFITITAIIYYMFTSLGTIVYSLAKRNISTFSDMGAYANTEVFLFATFFLYLMYSWFGKSKRNTSHNP